MATPAAPIVFIAPPKFGDLGKPAKDLLSKEYHHPNTKLEILTKTKEGVVFKTNVAKVGGLAVADFETKFLYRPFAATITEKWNTQNVLSQTISLLDPLVQGLKVDLDSSYAPSSGDFKGKVTTTFSRPHYTAQTVTDIATSSILGSVTFSYEKFLLGVQSSFNYSKGVVGKHSGAIGYTIGDSIIHASSDFTDKVTASVYHRICSQLQAGAQVDVAKSKGGDFANTFAVGGQYRLDSGAFVKAKINNDAHLALSYTQAVSKGAVLGLSMLVDTTNINADSHKVGLNLVLTA